MPILRLIVNGEIRHEIHTNEEFKTFSVEIKDTVPEAIEKKLGKQSVKEQTKKQEEEKWITGKK